MKPLVEALNVVQVDLDCALWDVLLSHPASMRVERLMPIPILPCYFGEHDHLDCYHPRFEDR